MASLHFSVVIPTYQRREVVLKSVASLIHQEFSGDFEIIVVVDGSHDGSTEALRKLRTPFPLTILEQPNRGAAMARNRGAQAARGEFLMFLDDDMISHPKLLEEHKRSHQDGWDVVVGHIPLHPDAPPSFLTLGLQVWADQRAEQLSSPGASLTLGDFLTGQLSLSREIFIQNGGFDTNFTLGGTFGNEDVDFGYRLMVNGYRFVFNPMAISWQYYIVTPRQYLRQRYQAGSADVTFARKHPELAQSLFQSKGSEEWINRIFWRRIFKLPFVGTGIVSLLRFLVLFALERGIENKYTVRLFEHVTIGEYWRGVHRAGDIPVSRPFTILAYHAIADLSGVPVLEPYGVPPAEFRRQLDSLLRFGFRFISAGEVLRFLQANGGLPRRAVLLTFDDCYEDLEDVVLPILKEKGIPAVAFAVSDRLGKTNDWDQNIGGGQRRLLDARGLLKLSQAGIEIGAHSRTHRSLTQIQTQDLISEIEGSIAELEALGVNRPQLFAYPYGETDSMVRKAVHEAGFKAAFTVNPAFVKPDQDPFLIPRVEILRSDTGWKFWWKIILAGIS